MRTFLKITSFVCLLVESLCVLGALSLAILSISLPGKIAQSKAAALVVVLTGIPHLKVRYSSHLTFTADSDSDPLSAPLGTLTAGPYVLPQPEHPMPGITPEREDVVLAETQNLVRETDPAKASDTLRHILTPLLLSQVGGALAFAAILEGIRRLLARVARDEVFCAPNVQALFLLGWAVLAWAAINLVSGVWLSVDFAQLPQSLLPVRGLRLTPLVSDWGLIILGNCVLGLAAIFRRGLRLQEENALTI